MAQRGRNPIRSLAGEGAVAPDTQSLPSCVMKRMGLLYPCAPAGSMEMNKAGFWGNLNSSLCLSVCLHEMQIVSQTRVPACKDYLISRHAPLSQTPFLTVWGVTAFHPPPHLPTHTVILL